eukprot:CAMPEP_0197024578 /NCGR_PEP_ID=MMETSP1384-20130603/5093_1 /TAXON_ID=29189 /ORGANISM="Ammonia sp." /LENGTH=961 /DNA_ID=CAMNT_0042452981 /DNA_START=48 /DNA_END=2933 /DNA_ORIENTATION=-
MATIEVDQGLRSQIIRILVKYGNAAIKIEDSDRLFFEEEKSGSFENIVIGVNRRSETPFIETDDSQEMLNFVKRAIQFLESDQSGKLCQELNRTLCLKTFLFGNNLSVADIASYVCIYHHFANLDDKQRYDDFLNVSRWIDIVQHKLKANATSELQLLSIPKAVPPLKKVEEKQAAPKAADSKAKGKGKAKGKASKQKSTVQLKDQRNDVQFISHRIRVFEEIYKRQCEEREKLPNIPIKIKLPDGTIKDGFKLKTTPLEIATNISPGLAKAVIVARVNGNLWDLGRPLEGDCDLVLLKWDDDEAKQVFWHSSSHVLGQSMERMLRGKLTIGPALDPSQMLHNGGFYYDVNTSDLGEDLHLSQAHYNSLEQLVKKEITGGKGQEFQRIEMTRKEAEEMFKFNQYKQEIINDIFDRDQHGKKGGGAGNVGDTEIVTAYRCGDLIDLCTGPHIPNTNRIKSFKITKNGATYWKNDNQRDFLQRLYGISFPDKKLMKEYEVQKKRAEEADHRNIGKKQNLFFFHDLSPGSCFWLPHGTRVYTKLREFISNEYKNRGFTEVISPNVFNFDLWKISGHAQNYKENMFLFECEDQEFGLKPMNCPGHCLMYGQQLRSYRDLPIRLADFGALHRNELSGSLTGLTRVRRFQQDDAHIFCRHDQISQEIDNCLQFIKDVYGVFGFRFELELSTRPEEKYLGEVAVWDRAEQQLKEALDKFVAECNEEQKTNEAAKDKEEPQEMKWKLNPGDGAFYGPKIDIKVFDSLNREHQCATIQLDFQLPLRFGLSYSAPKGDAAKTKKDEKEKKEDGKVVDEELEHLQKKYLHTHGGEDMEIPVIIHRAIYGSFERFIAILTEHLLGKWPFWLSPRQIIVIPVTPAYNGYAHKVGAIFATGAGTRYWCDVDDSRDRLNNKIRKAQTNQYNFILVVGEKEEENNTVNIRTRDNVEHGMKSIDDTLKWFQQLIDEHQ